MVSKRITKKFLSHLFDKFYRYAYEMNRRGNFCKIQSLGNGQVTCKGLFRATKYVVTSLQLCCVGCKHLGPKGCKVQALACRLWYCDPDILIKRRNPGYKSVFIFDESINMVRIFPYRNNHHKRIIKQAARYGLLKFRSGKVEAVEFAWDIIKNKKPNPFLVNTVDEFGRVTYERTKL